MFLWKKRKSQSPSTADGFLFAFKDETAAIAYVEAQLQDCVPAGWSFRKSEDHSLSWLIEKRDLQPGEWPNKDYQLTLSKDLAFLVITFGNRDMGGLSDHHCLLDAKLIPAICLQMRPLGTLLRTVFSKHDPNEWGYS
jgi:hypothetical protein